MHSIVVSAGSHPLTAKTAAIILSVLAVVSFLDVPSHARPSGKAFPPVVLWAWERPEHLDFIDPGKVGVAFLARSIELSGAGVLEHPRLQPLSVPAGTMLSGVVRITTSRRLKPVLSPEQIRRTAESVMRVCELKGLGSIQIDFDAARSERAFYRELLSAVRARMPDSLSLSITALASWCLDDVWIDGLPVDEAVPMLFRLGPDGPEILRRLRSGDDFATSQCRSSIGISADEPAPFLPAGRRVYVFSPNGWSRDSFLAVFRKLGR